MATSVNPSQFQSAGNIACTRGMPPMSAALRKVALLSRLRDSMDSSLWDIQSGIPSGRSEWGDRK